MKKMGSLEEIVAMLPGMSRQAREQTVPDAGKLKRYEAILLSMTPRERRLPRTIDGSRRRGTQRAPEPRCAR